MDIIACPNCGSRRIYQGTMGDGVLTGYTSRNVCRDCGYQGMPLIFNTETDYKNFLSRKSIEKKPMIFKENKIKKEKEKQKIKRPIGIILLAFILILIALISLYLYYSIYLYYNLFGFNTTTLLWIYYISIFVVSAIILPYGLLKGSGWAWTISAILFAMSIPIGLIFLYYITRPHIRTFYGKD